MSLIIAGEPSKCNALYSERNGYARANQLCYFNLRVKVLPSRRTQPEVWLDSPFTDKHSSQKTGRSLMDEDVIGKVPEGGMICIGENEGILSQGSVARRFHREVSACLNPEKVRTQSASSVV